MPELPEVQSTLNHLQAQIVGQTIQTFTARTTKLRWPIDPRLVHTLKGLKIQSISRRAKYLLLNTLLGNVVIHLGMSGSLQIVSKKSPAGKHDHIDLELNDHLLRFCDPRKFGAWLWIKNSDLKNHKLFAALGPEPLEDSFDGNCLWQMTRKKNTPIKQFLMQAKNVVGVGNIYASESLFAAKIHPLLPAHKLTHLQCQSLVHEIKTVLLAAISAGGSTLKNFITPDGKPGYFAQNHRVYGRAKQPCLNCHTTIEKINVAQRSTFFCPQCQINN
jgi:formamidopyrimidine-DNA glycosylase